MEICQDPGWWVYVVSGLTSGFVAIAVYEGLKRLFFD